MLIYLSLFKYAYSWSRVTEVKTEPNRDRGGPRPDRDRDLDRMVCQKPDRDRDRPTLSAPVGMAVVIEPTEDGGKMQVISVEQWNEDPTVEDEGREEEGPREPLGR